MLKEDKKYILKVEKNKKAILGKTNEKNIRGNKQWYKKNLEE